MLIGQECFNVAVLAVSLHWSYGNHIVSEKHVESQSCENLLLLSACICQ